MDGRLNADMSDRWAKVALACAECRFAFGALENRDQMRFLAVVAKYFGNSACVVISLHVRFIQLAMGSLAWWFASYLKR